ncbi:MAG: hypothetical protein DMD84_02375 [Candidatus Rokuibacteriota bacterium]|nr:MAG: hypothetical protein DMD84_02375 [Candidatus Rokubacteria bacterium]
MFPEILIRPSVAMSTLLLNFTITSAMPFALASPTAVSSSKAGRPFSVTLLGSMSAADSSASSMNTVKFGCDPGSSASLSTVP